MARKVYVGAPKTEVVTGSNIGSWFTFSDPDGISSWNGTTVTVTGVYANERVKFTALQDMTVSFDYNMDSFCKISFSGKYICDEGDIGSYTGTLTKGKSFYISNSSTISAQTSTLTNITCTTASAVARKVKKFYVGVDNVARRVKKGYIGIGGVARPFWGEYELTYYGTTTALSVARERLSATTVGNYGLFAGGMNTSGYASNVVDAYSKTLTRTTPTAMTHTRRAPNAETIGNYALIAGGYNHPEGGYNASVLASVETYNTSLTKGTASALGTGRENFTSATVGDYAIFAGGETGGGSTYTTAVDAYNASLTKTSPTQLSTARQKPAGASIGGYALIAGGRQYQSNLNAVETYNTSLTKGTATALSVARGDFCGATIGGYAVFAGGYVFSNTYKSTVDAYNASLTRSTPTALSFTTADHSMTTLGKYLIIAGGHNSTWGINNVNVYDESLTRTIGTSLSAGRTLLDSTTVGDYALFGGGSASSRSAVVDAFVLM